MCVCVCAVCGCVSVHMCMVGVYGCVWLREEDLNNSVFVDH